jgi:hypothetical protein
VFKVGVWATAHAANAACEGGSGGVSAKKFHRLGSLPGNENGSPQLFVILKTYLPEKKIPS